MADSATTGIVLTRRLSRLRQRHASFHRCGGQRECLVGIQLHRVRQHRVNTLELRHLGHAWRDVDHDAVDNRGRRLRGDTDDLDLLAARLRCRNGEGDHANYGNDPTSPLRGAGRAQPAATTLDRGQIRRVELLPGGVARNLSADKTAAALRKIRPTDPVGAMRRHTIVELLAELRSLDRKRKTIDAELGHALTDDGTCLMRLDGIGPVAAATIISIVGDVRRFPNADHFASFTGTAPVAASSGEVVRYRLNLGGQREMNKVLHIAARVQSNMPNSAGRVYIHRKLAEGKTRAEATRSLKRHLSNVVYRALQADQATHEVSGEDNQAA